jgi:hypothetical protein
LISSPACLSEKFHCWFAARRRSLFALSSPNRGKFLKTRSNFDSISLKDETKTPAVRVKSGPRIADTNTHIQCQSLARYERHKIEHPQAANRMPERGKNRSCKDNQPISKGKGIARRSQPVRGSEDGT